MRTVYEEMDRKAIEKVKSYMHEHCHESFDAEKIAAMVFFSVSKLNKTFKRIEGCGPASYHRRMKIHFAQELARKQPLNWTVIGYQLGYSDLPSLARPLNGLQVFLHVNLALLQSKEIVFVIAR